MAILGLQPYTLTFPQVDTNERIRRDGWLFEIDAKPLYDHENLVLFRVPTDSPTFRSGRTTIMTCGLCGDEGCGALAARVTAEGDWVLWTDFAHQDPLEDPRLNTTELLAWAPMRFDRANYDAVMSRLPKPVARWV